MVLPIFLSVTLPARAAVQSLPDIALVLGNDLTSGVADRNAFDPTVGASGKYFLPRFHPEIQESVDQLLEIFFATETARTNLRSFAANPYLARFHFGSSLAAAKRILQKAGIALPETNPYRAIPFGPNAARELFNNPTGVLYSKDFAPEVDLEMAQVAQSHITDAHDLLKDNFPEDVQQLFRNKLSFIFVDSTKPYCFSSWSDDLQNTMFVLEAGHFTSFEIFQGLIHEIAIRKDRRNKPLAALDHGQKISEAVIQAARNDTLQYALAIARAFNFEARALGELAHDYDVPATAKLMGFPDRLKKNCGDAMEGLIDLAAKESSRTDVTATKLLWRGIQNENFYFHGQKQSLCEYWTTFELTAPIIFSGGGPRPRCDGW